MGDDAYFMAAALAEAKAGAATGGIPIGSVLVHRGTIIGRGHNLRVQSNDPILHAEMSAIQNAGRQPASVYRECVLYSTLSPCPMCSGTALLFKIPRIVVGENVNFQGPEAYLRASGVDLCILNDTHCIKMMREFIEQNPHLWHEDIAV